MHMMLQGPPRQIVSFIAYVKREISYRWGQRPEVRWPGTMWCSYICTALPTPESQTRCLEYILGHGVKEGLVAKPQLWPGINSAGPLLRDGVIRGEWFDGTGYSRAIDAEHRRKRARRIRKADYYSCSDIVLSPIPAWRALGAHRRTLEIRRMLERIEAEGTAARKGRRPLGAKAVMRIPLTEVSDLPRVPWLERRRKMISWSDPTAPQTHSYARLYWRFQREFRLASTAYRSGRIDPPFPPGAFVPMRYQPPDACSVAA
jgi:hypothetical protein